MLLKISNPSFVTIVLWILVQAESPRNTAHRFLVSQFTVSTIITTLLPILELLHAAFVCLPADNWLNLGVELDPRKKAFSGCIGAIGGTHVASVRSTARVDN